MNIVAPVWHHAQVKSLLPTGRYHAADVARITHALNEAGTLSLRPLPTGLFPAASAAPEESGYDNVWVRDNVQVAYAEAMLGHGDVAARAMGAILRFWWGHRHRFDAIIAGDADPDDVMQRPHVRFDGATLRELPDEKWSHAQNDALGYALWLSARLVALNLLPLDPPVVGMLALIPRYFAAIRYWDDQDSGHWEEARKREASSIGTALAGLLALTALGEARREALRAADFPLAVLDVAAELAEKGRAALDAILPAECVDPSPRLQRRYDAALLFLVHPLGVVTGAVAEQIVADVLGVLAGPYGIRRYPGDSYWAPDYDLKVAPLQRTRDYSDDPWARDALLERRGDEAQWCIFDPMLSAHFGARYRATRDRADLEMQVQCFERALSQITPAWRCPELYYLRHGSYVAGPHTPLLWTVANLSVALAAMETSAASAD